MRSIVMLTGFAVIGGLLAACLVAADGESKSASKQVARQQPPTDTVQAGTIKINAPEAERSDDERAIRQVADKVAQAYNAKDGEALAALFTADAEIVDAQGHRFQGGDAVRQVFVAAFRQYPQAQIEIEIDTIRFLGRTVAVEDGVSRLKHRPDAAAEEGRYSVVHVKQDGQWLMASTHDLLDDEATAATELERLSWLVGSWVDESPEALITTTYRWADNDKYLLGEFTVRIHGQEALTGTERIGWDPLAKKLRSWVFDSDGGYAEGLWTRQDQEWVLKLSGVTRDGHVGSATNVYNWQGADKYTFQSRDRVVGGKLTEDTKPTTIVRQPPPPGR